MTTARTRISALLAAALLAAGVAHAQPRAPAADRPTGFPARCAPGEVQAMLLGTFHFAGSPTDDISGPAENVLHPTWRRQLDALAGRLAPWRPEQIAVEWPARRADSTAARYARYLAAGGVSSDSDEVVQMGFRLARRLGHPAVHPIDHQLALGNDSIPALLARRPDLVRKRDSPTVVLRAAAAAEARLDSGRTLVERLRVLNTDEGLHGGNSRAMFAYLVAGDGENRGGPQLLARWYERNFYMAHHLARALRPGTRRVLVLVGAGHVPPLRTILDESPDFCPVSPLPYLR